MSPEGASRLRRYDRGEDGKRSGKIYLANGEEHAFVFGDERSRAQKCTERWRPRPAARLTFAEASATRGAINLGSSVLGAAATLGKSANPVNRVWAGPRSQRKRARQAGPSSIVVRSGYAATSTGVAVSDDLAARDLLFGRIISSFSSRIQVATNFVESMACSARLEETERAEDAVAGLDQVVTGEPGKLFELGDEGLVDLPP